MKKAKKRIAIICVLLNLVMLSQLCFGSVSSFYDAVASLVGEDEHMCDGDHDHGDDELQAESVCTKEELENAKCHICSPISERVVPTMICGREKLVQFFPPKWEKCDGVIYKYWKCGALVCPYNKNILFTYVCFDCGYGF